MMQAGAKTQDNQHQELTNQLIVLKATQAKYLKVKENLIEEVALLNKKIMLFETSNDHIEIKNKNLQTVIENMLRDIQQTKQKIEESEASCQTTKRKFIKEEKKMVEYQKKVEKEMEKKSIYKRALKEQDQIAAMKKQRDDILSQLDFDATNLNIDDLSKIITEIHSKIELNKMAKTKLTEKRKTLQTQMCLIKKAMDDLEQEIKVIEKHNTAKLLRLQCQLKKAQEVLDSKTQFK